MAFLAHGLDYCYPRTNRGLMQSIIETGAVISQYPVGTEPMKFRFIQRNLLMAEWADDVVIIEAGEKSGAISTAEFALSLKKNVFAVPNNIFSSNSSGCNMLLNKGAKAYTSCDLGSDPKSDPKSQLAHSGSQLQLPHSNLLDLLRIRPYSFNELSQTLGAGEINLYESIMELEFSGSIQSRSDGLWHFVGW